MIRPLLTLALPLLLAACIFPEDRHCVDYPPTEPVPLQEQRDPQTGLCEAFGGGEYGGFSVCDDDQWGGAEAEGAPAWNQGWAVCYQQCEGLDEATCLGTSACRAAYLADDVYQAREQSFYECWGTAPSGPIQGGDCAGLDAQECSMHDDCSAVHGVYDIHGDEGGWTTSIADFQSCIDEDVMQGCYGDTECGDGFHCNADTECLPSPSCGGSNGVGDAPCDTACYGFCVPDENPNPGTCTGDLSCFDTLAPNCPIDTVPGILDGCWSGYCIPVDDCSSVAECPALSESDCVLRSDCNALYEGVDCTCIGEACTCADWLFESCEAGIDTLPATP